MFPTATHDIYANRFVPHTDYIDIVGYDFTAAVADMEVRDRRNGGSIKATVVPVVTVSTVEGLPVSRITWTIAEAVMEVMPTDAIDPGNSVSLYYDVRLTPDGGTVFIPFGGRFVVVAGVTE